VGSAEARREVETAPPERKQRGRERGKDEEPQLRLQALRAEAPLGGPRPFPRQDDESALEDMAALEEPEQRRALRAAPQIPLDREIEQRAADEGDRAHRQGQVEAVPYRQAVLRRPRAQDRDHRG